MYDQHIIIDLEMNPVSKKNKEIRKALSREIIEIGAVKLNEKLDVIDSFKCFVKAEYNPNITSYITDLTGITNADVYCKGSLRTAMSKLESWIGYEKKARIYSWSNADLMQIQKECHFKDIDIPSNLRRWLNLQKIYSRVMGEDICCKQMSLKAAAAQFGIVIDELKSHSALYDAEITSELLVSILNGNYKKQAELLRNTARKTVETPVVFCLGDIFKMPCRI